MERYFIIIESVKKELSQENKDKIISDSRGKAIKFNTLLSAKNYIFHTNIKSAIIFERASIQINTNGYDPTEK